MKKRDPERIYGTGRRNISSDEELDITEIPPSEYSSLGIISVTPAAPTDETPASHHPQRDIVVRDRCNEGGFSQIPNVVLRDPRLTSNAKVVYCLLLSYAWSKDSCFPGQERLAKDMGVDRRTIIRTMAELNEQGLISWKRRGLGKTNIYYLEKLAEVYHLEENINPEDIPF